MNGPQQATADRPRRIVLVIVIALILAAGAWRLSGGPGFSNAGTQPPRVGREMREMSRLYRNLSERIDRLDDPTQHRIATELIAELILAAQRAQGAVPRRFDDLNDADRYAAINAYREAMQPVVDALKGCAESIRTRDEQAAGAALAEVYRLKQAGHAAYATRPSLTQTPPRRCTR